MNKVTDGQLRHQSPGGTLMLTKAEYEAFQRTGSVEFDDPYRGKMKITRLADYIDVKVLRAGDAASFRRKEQAGMIALHGCWGEPIEIA